MMSGWALGLALLVAPPPAVGREAPALPGAAALPTTVTRDEVLTLVRERSPSLRSLVAEVDVVRAEEVQARLWPNPELRYVGYSRLFGTAQAINGQQHQVEVGFPLLIAGQTRTRRRAAEARTRAAEAQSCVVTTWVAREGASRFVALLAAQERLAVLMEGDQALAATEALTQARAGVGAQTKFDALRVSTERETFAVELSDARSALVDAAARLAAVVGAPQWRPRAVGTLEPGPRGPADFAARWAADGQGLPVVQSATRAQEAAVAERHAAGRERWPIPEIWLGSYLTTDGGSGSLVGGLRLPLPVLDRGQGLLARARAVERATAARRAEVELSAAAELRRSLDVLAERRTSVLEFQRSALARAPELRSMAYEAYRGGVSRVFELLDAERAWLDVRLRWIDLLERLAFAELDVQFADGTLGRQFCPNTR